MTVAPTSGSKFSTGKPEGGYDDALGIQRAVFIGHSIAGEELRRLGTRYPDRVDRLVYMDAYDYADRFKLDSDIPPPPYIESYLLNSVQTPR
jgi:pimeloyl-ACP methyl ester carboxylesterase